MLRRRWVVEGRGRIWGIVLALAVVVPVTSAPATAQEAARPAVGVAPVALQDVTPKARFTGRAEAIDRVELRARVQGFLQERGFEEGQRVEAGTLLFVIEQAPYEAVLAQRRAELASAEAEVETAALQLERGEQLLRGNNIPAAEVDERRARLLVAEGKAMEADAAVRAAEIDLGYTDITAPITGRIGRAAYSVGAFVGPESGALATLVRQDPVYVTFPVSQSIITRARQEAIAGGGELDIVARAELPTGELYPAPGRLAFAEVEVQAGTDTLTLRATFPNPDGLLIPGQFLNVVLELGEPVEALAVPTAALLADQAGLYVLVVGADEVVEQRRVELGSAEGASTIVTQGLREGELVVVEGIQKVRPGQAVTATRVAGLQP
ncbi:MAG: efflux RND transporter periplasmic adaptor subunit [Pseudomonadota bacterium]